MQLGFRTRSLVPLGLLLILASTSPRAATWRVQADGTGDLPTIQDAIDGAAGGDTIRVGPGDYAVSLWIEGKGIILISDQGPSSTVLHGVSLQDSPVIDVFYDGGTGSIIEGFTIRDGTTGIRVNSASPTIRGNTIIHNESALGAGICCTFGSNAVIDGNLIAHNRTWYQCCFPSRGGGVYADETSAAIIRNNVIAYNTCDGECIGGGVSVFVATVEGNTSLRQPCGRPRRRDRASLRWSCRLEQYRVRKRLGGIWRRNRHLPQRDPLLQRRIRKSGRRLLGRGTGLG